MTSRIQRIRRFLYDKNLDAMIVSSVSNIFYLTGISHFSKEEREAYVLITKHNAYFFTTSLYIEEVHKRASGFDIQTIGRDESFEDLLQNICERESLENIGFEEHDIRYGEYYWIQQATKSLIPLFLPIRIQKEAEEIEKIQAACTMGDKAFAHALQQITAGVTEKHIATDIELFLKQHNSDISFRPIVAFGENTSMPHYESSAKRQLQHNEPVLIDMGAKVEGYCSDMTRTVFFGMPTDKQKSVYQTVLASQQKAIEYIQTKLNNNEPLTAKAVDAVSRKYIIDKGYPTIPHSLGHGIGIDVHELPSVSPSSDIRLTSGMVFSIEPGIYIPDGMGVRIEDLVVIENKKLRILTLSSKELLVL